MLFRSATGDVRTGPQPSTKPDPRELPFAKEALAQVEKGGFPEALARIGALLGQFAGPIPLNRLALTDEFVRSDKILSRISEEDGRRMRSEAGVMVLLEPERTLDALPKLLSNKEDRERALTVLDWARGMDGITKEQRGMIDRIASLLRENAVKGKAEKAKKKAGK